MNGSRVHAIESLLNGQANIVADLLQHLADEQVIEMAAALAAGEPVISAIPNIERAVELLAANQLCREIRRRLEVAELEAEFGETDREV